MLQVDKMIEVLPLAIDGWLGVFLVTAVAIAAIYFLTWITGKKDDTHKKD